MLSLSQVGRATGALGSSMALLFTFAIPHTPAASATEFEALQLPTYSLEDTQTLTVQDYDSEPYLASIVGEMPKVELSQEWLAAEAARVAAEEAAAAQASQSQSEPPVYRDVPAGAGSAGLVQAALAQVGVHQDCTDLVQNSLAAVGLTERRDRGGFDLGTGIWQYDHFGTRVDINSLAPGDILVYGNAGSGAHVAIYIGDGQAVHGGYSGNTVVASVHSSYQSLTGAIRI